MTASGDAWGTALRLLTRRDYGSAELRRALLSRGCPAEDVEAALERATELGYLDDARYAERLARTLRDSGRAAGGRLGLELRLRGLDEELIAGQLASEEAKAGEEAALRALLARRFPAFDFASADAGERRRVIHFLQRRGFTLDRILRELKRTDS